VDPFLGDFPRTLDAKNRVQLPAKWKKDLPEDLVLVPYSARDKYPSIRVYSKKAFATFMSSIFASEGGFDPSNPDHNDRRAYYSFAAKEAQQDSVGRIILPASLREFAQMDKDLVIAGEWEFISLWGRDVFERYREHAKVKAVFR
jgi:MraZ protein